MKRFGFVVFVVVFSLFVSSSSSFSSATEELEGKLEIMVVTPTDHDSHNPCQMLYSIRVGKEKIPFSLPAHAPPNLKPGQKIRIAGRWEESNGGKSFHCRKVTSDVSATAVKKAASSTMGNISSGYLPEQTPVLGAQRTLAVLIAFPDHTVPDWGKEKAENKVFKSEPTDKYPNDHSDNAYWKECSGGKMWLEGECLNGWKSMSKNASEYGYGSNEERKYYNILEANAIGAVDKYVDFTQYDRLIFIRTGEGWAYAFATRGKHTYFTNDGMVEFSTAFVNEGDEELNRDYISHEFGHELGLVHANSRIASTGEIYTYGDLWENRGGKFAQLDGLHKYMLGWMDADKIKIIASSGDYWLDQREMVSDGTKLLAISLGLLMKMELGNLYFIIWNTSKSWVSLIQKFFMILNQIQKKMSFF